MTRKMKIIKGKITGEKEQREKEKASSNRRYRCPKRGEPYGLDEITRKIIDDQEFARFFRRLLCAANSGDEKAQKYVQSYYDGPTERELDMLCIKRPKDRKRVMKCTEQNRLVDVVAYVFGETDREKYRAASRR